MNTTETLIPIVTVKKFMLPKYEYSLVINSANQYDQLNGALLSGAEVGVPFWFCNKYNVYGCTAKVKSIYQNDKKGFSRIKVQSLRLFRLKTYSKTPDNSKLNEASVKILNFDEERITDPKILSYFAKLTESKFLTPNPEIKLLELLGWLKLNPELSIAVIAKSNQADREKLLSSLLKFQLSIKQQSKIKEFN